MRLPRPSNRGMRILVGVMIAGLFCIQCTRTEAFRESDFVQAISGKDFGSTPPGALAEIDRLAKSDHVALLERCLANYQGRYRDYACTFIKQERINGALGKQQWIDVKFMDEPFSVAMKWTQNAPLGEAALYVEGKYNNQMLVKPTGLWGKLLGTVVRQPDGKEAMQNTLRPINLFGFERGLENLLAVYRQAKQNGDLKEEFGGYADVAGRKTVVLVRQLPPKHDYPAAKTLVFVDVDRLVPVRIEGYDWDNQITSQYTYKDVKLNTGLTEDDFLPEANGMKPPQ